MSWHQVSAALTARCTCCKSRPTRAVCRTVPGAQPAIAQLGESIGDGCDRTEDAPDAIAAVGTGSGRGVEPERKLRCMSQFG